MVIEFNQEQFALFIESHEEELAKIAWKKYKKRFSDRAKSIELNGEAIAYMTQGIKKAKHYLNGYENDPQFNKWLSGYLSLHFHIGENFDEHPWRHNILIEKLWHPYKRLDILMNILTATHNDPSQKDFYTKLEELN